MKRISTTVLIFLCLAVGSQGAWAELLYKFEGSISGGEGEGLYGTAPWDKSDTVLKWDVEYDSGGSWTYQYTFAVQSDSGADVKKAISRVIIQVPDKFVEDYIIKDGTTPGYELGYYSDSDKGKSNPGMPAEIKGLKWDLTPVDNEHNYSWFIETDRMPMWGDFYAKDGKYKDEAGNENDVYAYNASFSSDLANKIAPAGFDLDYEKAPFGFVLVPDIKTLPVPEPATMLLLGLGLVGIALVGRRKFLK